MFADAQRLDSAVVSVSGSGYQAGDCLFVAGGKWLLGYDCGASVQVTAVDGNGGVTAVVPTRLGAYWTPPLSPNLVTGGHGSGCQLTLSMTLYWPNSPWIWINTGPANSPASSILNDLIQVLDPVVLSSFDQNINSPNPAPPGTPIDYSKPTRSGQLLLSYVNDVRQAIQLGGKVPLSVETQSDGTPAPKVPPEAVPLVLNMAAWQITNAVPNLKMAVITDKGQDSLMRDLANEGREWLNAVRHGANVTWPSDPDPAWQPPIKVGSIGTPADLESFSAPRLQGFPIGQIGYP
jgi:hypothetical protein